MYDFSVSKIGLSFRTEYIVVKLENPRNKSMSHGSACDCCPDHLNKRYNNRSYRGIPQSGTSVETSVVPFLLYSQYNRLFDVADQ